MQSFPMLGWKRPVCGLEAKWEVAREVRVRAWLTRASTGGAGRPPFRGAFLCCHRGSNMLRGKFQLADQPCMPRECPQGACMSVCLWSILIQGPAGLSPVIGRGLRLLGVRCMFVITARTSYQLCMLHRATGMMGSAAASTSASLSCPSTMFCVHMECNTCTQTA